VPGSIDRLRNVCCFATLKSLSISGRRLCFCGAGKEAANRGGFNAASSGRMAWKNALQQSASAVEVVPGKKK
jgi:hypothetical protein